LTKGVESRRLAELGSAEVSRPTELAAGKIGGAEELRTRERNR
jgi:hypothetical protein